MFDIEVAAHDPRRAITTGVAEPKEKDMKNFLRNSKHLGEIAVLDSPIGAMRLGLGAVLLAVPILLGFAYTASASVGGDEDADGSHSVDQWIINEDDQEFTFDREEVNGVVSLVVTDSNGNVVQADEFPDFVADTAAEFGDPNWAPMDWEIFDEVDGTPCYHPDALHEARNHDGSDQIYGMQQSDDSRTFALESWSDGRIDTAFFDRQISHEVLDEHLATGRSYMELDGAQPLNPCS